MSTLPGKKIIGLTGNIATGKSVVRRMAEHLGAYTIDADALSHRVISKGGPGYQSVLDRFGTWLLDKDGQIDRTVLGRMVFAEPAARRTLEAIVHPRILEAEAHEAAALAGRSSVVVTDGSLLVEGGYHTRFRRLVVVHCDPGTQIERLMRRNHITKEDAERRVAAQMSSEEKRKYADYEIDTTGTFDDTRQRVVEVFNALKRLRPSST